MGLSTAEFKKALEDAGFSAEWEARGEARGRAEVLDLLKKTGYDTAKLEKALKKTKTCPR